MALQDKLSPKGLLWELIFPQDASGQPTKTASGKYHVKCFVMDEWRRVTVDCRIPVDAYGAPLLVGSMPAQLWPLILSKAILKLMALYQVANGIAPSARSVLHVLICASTPATSIEPSRWQSDRVVWLKDAPVAAKVAVLGMHECRYWTGLHGTRWRPSNG